MSISIAEESINTLNQLVEVLTESEKEEFSKILKNTDLSGKTCKSHQSWSEEKYTRNCVEENESFELILICWEKNQKTPIHDHGGEECWVHVISGEFEETIYTKDEDDFPVPKRKLTLSEGDLTYMVDFMGVHSLKNIANEKAMTLHLYAKPIKSCNVFDAEAAKFVSKEMAYDCN